MEKEHAASTAPSATWEKVSPELDAALATLTSHQQNVVVMRLMQQKPQADVARELGCAESSVSAVLSRSLEKLRGRLSKMGICLSAAALGAMLTEHAVTAAPAGLVAAVQAVCLGQATASASASALSNGAAKAMLMTKLKMAAVVLAGTAAVGAGGALTFSKLAAAEMARPVDKQAAKAVLTAANRWRTFAMLGPRAISGKSPAKTGGKLRTAPPPSGWADPKFDDRDWARAAGPFPGGPLGWASVYRPYNRALFCMRGAFALSDPAAVKRLTLTMKYQGGAVVYLNGQEVYRRHLPKGELEPDTPADPFPEDAYVDSAGKIIPEPYHASAQVRKGDKDLGRRIALRTARSLGPIALPAGALVKGVNILAIELHRATFRPEALKWRGKSSKAGWAHIGLLELRLAADTGQGAIATGAADPGKLQVWNADPHRQLTGSEYADAAEKIRPVKLVGARGGVYSGVVATRLPKDTASLVAKLSALKGPGTVPAGNVTLRYAGPTKLGFGRKTVLAALDEAPRSGDAKNTAAVRPVWITVRVPQDAAPGKYSGSLSISAPGAGSAEVPLELEVVGWTLPESKSFGTYMGVYQSYDSLALQYGVPLWSEKHWKLVEKSWQLLGLMGNNLLVVPLVCRTEFGNDESLIPWIKGKDGAYSYDFKAFDRYLEIATRNCGIKVVSAQVYFGGGWGAADPAKRPVAITVLDPATGKRQPMTLPPYGSDEAKKLWRPFIAALQERLAKKGLKDKLVLGLGHCGGMHKQVLAHFSEVAPGVTWHIARHNRRIYAQGGKNESYCEYLYVAGDIPAPAAKRNHGWKRPGREMFVMCQRIYDDGQPAVCMRTMAERALLLGDAGPGRICLDYWPVKGSSQHGGRKSIFDRFPNARAGQRCPHLSYLSVPDEKGPALTQKILMLREGLQEAEGRIFLERALLEKKIDGDLAARVQKLLDERVTLCRLTHNGGGSLQNAGCGEGWRLRSARLYRMLAKVSKQLGK